MWEEGVRIYDTLRVSNNFPVLQVLQAHLSNFGWAQIDMKWPFCRSTYCSSISLLWLFLSLVMKGNSCTSSLFVTAVGFHRLLLILWASIGWFHRLALGLCCPYGWAFKLMSWSLLRTHLELILDGYVKCVGCTCGLWAWMARELIIMGFRLIVWVSSTHRFNIHKSLKI